MRERPLPLPQQYPHQQMQHLQRVIQKTPSAHKRRTRRNTPMTAIDAFNEPNWYNDTQQQAPPAKPTILVPNRRQCQPPRVSKKRTVEGKLIGIKRNDVKRNHGKESNN